MSVRHNTCQLPNNCGLGIAICRQLIGLLLEILYEWCSGQGISTTSCVMKQLHQLTSILLYTQALFKMYIAQRLYLHQSVVKLALRDIAVPGYHHLLFELGSAKSDLSASMGY